MEQRIQKAYASAPKTWLWQLLAAFIVACLLAWSGTAVQTSNPTSNGLEVAGNIISGIFHPSAKLLFTLGTNGVPYLLLETFCIAFLGTIVGAVISLLPVYFLEKRYVKFETDAVWYAQIAKLVLVLGLAMAVKSVLKAPLNALLPGGAGDAIRYFVLVLFAGCILRPAAPGYGTPAEAYAALPAAQGVLDGYQTMDALAALNFGAVIALRFLIILILLHLYFVISFYFNPLRANRHLWFPRMSNN